MNENFAIGGCPADKQLFTGSGNCDVQKGYVKTLLITKQNAKYAVPADGNLDAIPYNRFTLETYFDTDESKRSKLVEIINQEFLAIASQGPRTQDLQKVKEFLTKQYQENLIENWYWQNVEIEKIITNLDIHTDYLTILEKIDEHAIQQFANVIVQTSNKKEIVQIELKVL